VDITLYCGVLMMTVHALAPLELSEYLRSFSFSK
jgi:hypothetical protein